MERQRQARSSSPTSAIDAMLDNLQGYYGAEYNETQRVVIGAYFLEKNPRSLPFFYAEIQRVKLYNKPLPLIEHFEEIEGRVNDRLREIRPEGPLMIDEDTLPREEIAAQLKALEERYRWVDGYIGNAKGAEIIDFQKKQNTA